MSKITIEERKHLLGTMFIVESTYDRLSDKGKRDFIQEIYKFLKEKGLVRLNPKIK